MCFATPATALVTGFCFHKGKGTFAIRVVADPSADLPDLLQGHHYFALIDLRQSMLFTAASWSTMLQDLGRNLAMVTRCCNEFVKNLFLLGFLCFYCFLHK